MLFWERFFCTWKMMFKTWLFLKDYGIKEEELQAILNYLLTIHEVIFKCLFFCAILLEFVITKVSLFPSITFFMPQDGSVEEVANTNYCSVPNCQYSCSDLSTMFNVKLKFIKPVSQNGFLCCSENRFA